MIYLLEEKLIELLKDRYPQDIKFAAGPAYAPDSRVQRMVAIAVASLETQPQPSIKEFSAPQRAAVYETRSVSLQADGATKSFKLPQQGDGTRVAEVVSGHSRALQSGDDYTVEGDTIHFYQPPSDSVQIELKGAQRDGYRERRPCNVMINVTSWTKKAPASDQLTQQALAIILDYFYGRDIIKLTDTNLKGFSFSLRNPVVTLEKLERATAKSNRARFIRSIATLHMHADLDLQLMRDDTATASVINDINYTTVMHE